MLIETIARLLARSDTPQRNFPPTELYNEGWMLRIILDWFAVRPDIQHAFGFGPRDRWYSEALLPSAFLARFRGDALAESWTHADGVIGEFEIGREQRGDLTLEPGARRFVVVEAKMYSGLSGGVTNARYFNQAARNVACIAETLHRANLPPSLFDKLAFFVIAPQSQIEKELFKRQMNPEVIREVVVRRVSEYGEREKESWLETWFLPTLEKIQLRELSWEEVIVFIQKIDQKDGDEISEFYQLCLRFNAPRMQRPD